MIGEIVYIAEEHDYVAYRNVYIYRVGIVESYHTHKSNQGMIKRMDQMDNTDVPYNF